MVRRVGYLALLIIASQVPGCFVEHIKDIYCNSDSDCPPDHPQCDRLHNSCVPAGFVPDMDGGTGDMPPVGCSMSSTCPPSAPVCSALQICAGCGAAGTSAECATFHPTTPLCGPNGGCVECLTKDNCDSVHNTCNATTHTCAPCSANADCTSGLCTAGACADKATLLYVNNAPTAGCSETGSGAFTTPFCTIQRGLNASAASGKTVVVFSGTYAESLQGATTLNGGNDYVAKAVGIGSPVVKPNSAGPALSELGTASKQVTLSFDGFVFDSSTLADNSNAIGCNGSGAAYGRTLLTVTHSTIKGAPAIGVSSQAQCSLTFDSDILIGNKSGAMKVDTTDFALSNLLIHNNGTGGATGSSFGGVYVSAAGETGKTSMFNLAVVNNVATSTALASGILCAAAPTALTNTLIFGNQGPATEVNASCSPSYSAFLGATGSNNETIPLTGCALTDLLVDPTNGDFHPKKGGMRPCTLIDQGTNTGAPDHDLDGVSRPQPSSGTDDIGCYEAK